MTQLFPRSKRIAVHCVVAGMALAVVVFGVLDGAVSQTRPALGLPGTMATDVSSLPTLMFLMGRKDVHRELGIVDEQSEQIAALLRRASLENDQVRAEFGGTRGLEEPREKAKRIQDALIKSAAELDRELERILLPHQVKRLRQLEIQSRFPGGTLAVFKSQEIAGKLKYSDDQLAAVKKRVDEVEQDIAQQIEKLMAEGREKIKESLTPEQREQYEELVGKPFRLERGAEWTIPRKAPERQPLRP